MIRRSPAEAYIKYLLIHPKGYTHDEIKEIMLRAQLDVLGGWYLEQLVEKLPYAPRPFLPNQKGHRPSQAYLLETGVYTFFWPDEAMKMAFKILETPQIKEFVETSIISRAPFDVIAKHLTTVRSFPCAPGDIQRYKDSFWNLDLLDHVELRAILELRVRTLAEHPNKEIASMALLYRKAFRTDARKVAAELPQSPLSAMVAQMKLGLMPSHKDLPKLVEATRTVAAVRALEAAVSDDPKAASRFRMYTSGMKNLTSILSDVARPDEELRDQLSAIALKKDMVLLPTVRELGTSSMNSQLLEVQHEHVDYGEDDEVCGEDGSNTRGD